VASGPGQPRFPAKFRVDYDAAADAYQLVFTMAGGR
jgi:hypothetical protein